MRRWATWFALAAVSAALPAAARAQDGKGVASRGDNPHGQLPKGLDCSSCHTANGWHELKNPLAFDHAQVTGFPLTGQHATVTCAQCHLGLRYDQVHVAAADCVGCHVDVHQGRLEGACSRCHNTSGFQEVPAVALHARSGFPLTGAHLQAPCESCHQNDRGGAFAPMATDCVSCHRQDYLAARMPDHAAAGFPTRCDQCHATLTWQGGVAFDHASVSRGFALVGAHGALQCAACHIPPNGTLRFSAADQNDCVACHQTQYASAHSGSGFPTTCLDCHNVNRWSDATFDHSKTGFSLLGAHAQLQCVSCHIQPGNALKFTPTGQNDCVACHQAQYNQAHSGSGFSTNCSACHNVNSWSGATFDHSQTGFALLGAHATLQCSSCHIQPGNALKSTPSGQNDCVACHQADYNRVHSGSGFSTNCTDCHTVNNWNANFDHTAFFPLSGNHAASCATCHTTAGSYSTFTCFQCHAHNQTDMNSKHQGVNGYSYDSNACYRCHPSGRSGG